MNEHKNNWNSVVGDKIQLMANSWIGKRPYQEDRYTYTLNDEEFAIISVFDGHGGFLVSQYCHDNFHPYLLAKIQSIPEGKRIGEIWKQSLQQIFQQFDEDILSKQEFRTQGSTVSTLIIDYKTTQATVVYLGDSRVAYLQKLGQDHNIYETNDHDYDNKEDEQRTRMRRERHNYMLCSQGIKLNVLRGFGDFHCKIFDQNDPYGPGASNKPDVLFTVPLSQTERSIFVLASDGIWKALPQGAKALPWNEILDVFEQPREKQRNAFEDIFFKPYANKSRDNITAVSILWNPEIIH